MTQREAEMRRHLNRSSNRVIGMNLEENEGTCGFAFPEGGLFAMGQEAIRPLHTWAGSRGGRRLVTLGNAT